MIFFIVLSVLIVFIAGMFIGKTTADRYWKERYNDLDYEFRKYQSVNGYIPRRKLLDKEFETRLRENKQATVQLK